MKNKCTYGGQPLLNKKAFTLIELLAVIVILAIIALIAVPIILNIVNDARESAKKRSVELYGKAIENAIAKSELKGEPVAAGDLIENFLLSVQYNGEEVSCTTNKLYADGSIYLSGCTVGGVSVDYTYGTEQTEASTQVYKPQYYGDWSFSGTVGSTNAPANPSTEPPTGKSFYIGYDVADGTVSAAYACFIRNDTEYCLKYGTDAYGTNADIIRDAYSDVDNACSFGDDNSNCSADGLFAYADPYGLVAASDDYAECSVSGSGGFECNEE